ncbi:hypothetical protein HCEG_06065 [Histoplasma capsulatum var. duboisii H88]|uniref:Uncharacterized protein n=1 Tax=Ajellomyces capsulatus (strain H88) TaxID=544711 RepID=F0UNT8_AJEC8|nr:hypothetical protein HCEG_06065 [Histoplasma capsulatum var. duboisii H88]
MKRTTMQVVEPGFSEPHHRSVQSHGASEVRRGPQTQREAQQDRVSFRSWVSMDMNANGHGFAESATNGLDVMDTCGGSDACGSYRRLHLTVTRALRPQLAPPAGVASALSSPMNKIVGLAMAHSAKLENHAWIQGYMVDNCRTANATIAKSAGGPVVEGGILRPDLSQSPPSVQPRSSSSRCAAGGVSDPCNLGFRRPEGFSPLVKQHDEHAPVVVGAHLPCHILAYSRIPRNLATPRVGVLDDGNLELRRHEGFLPLVDGMMRHGSPNGKRRRAKAMRMNHSSNTARERSSRRLGTKEQHKVSEEMKNSGAMHAVVILQIHMACREDGKERKAQI